jgi:MFS family permease
VTRTTDEALVANIRLYPWYAATFSAFAWMPVFFLFFNERVPLADVLRLEAIYYAAVVLLEVPSGYFSDAVGRRRTLLISALAFAVASGLFLIGRDFATLAAAQVLLAAGFAFNSGTDTAFHYDSLVAAERTDEFGAREAIAARNGFASTAIAALAGGAIGVIQLRWAYAISFLASVGSVIIVLRWIEPPVDRAAARGRNVVVQIRRCAGDLRSGALRWLFGFAVLMTILNHIPYEFYQPYIDLAIGSIGEARATPLVSGVHAFVALAVGAAFAARSVAWGDRWGTTTVLLSGAALQGVVIAVMGLLLHPLIVAVALLRVAPRGLATAPLNAAVAPRVPAGRRATYLSIQSLAGRLAFSLTLLGLSLFAGGGDAADWPALSRMLRISAILAAAGFIILFATRSKSLQRQSAAADS